MRKKCFGHYFRRITENSVKQEEATGSLFFRSTYTLILAPSQDTLKVQKDGLSVHDSSVHGCIAVRESNVFLTDGHRLNKIDVFGAEQRRACKAVIFQAT